CLAPAQAQPAGTGQRRLPGTAPGGGDHLRFLDPLSDLAAGRRANLPDPELRLPAGRGSGRPRHIEPPDGRRPGLARGRCRHADHRCGRGRDDWPDRWILPGLARWHHLDPDQYFLRHSRSAGRADSGAHPGSGAGQDHLRHRCDPLDGYGATRAGPDLFASRARVRRGGQGFRYPSEQDPVPPHPAERVGTDHRPGHLRGPAGHPLRGLFELPRSRRPAAHPILGCDGRRRLPCPPHRTPHRPRAGHRAVLDPDGVQLPRRRSSRRARPEAETVTAPVLQVKDLKTQFFTDDGVVKAVDGVSFDLHPGETLGIVGESGCGKSVTALSILRLVQEPGRITSGQILFKGTDIVTMPDDDVRDIRGKDIAMIFQDPLSSLNPVLSVGYQIEEAMEAHNRISGKVALSRAIQLLKQVRIPAAESRVEDYPHQFSGGMRQRAMIAMGLANKPSILIADEPTTALDVTVQAQILELLRDLNEETKTRSSSSRTTWGWSPD